MARIRTIKPEFFTSNDIVSLTPLARLFYVSLWCEADREGRMTWNVKTLKMRYLPADDCDISTLAQELIDADMIVIYSVNGKKYAVIPSFINHQIINNREAQSVIPDVSKRDDFCSDASSTRESGAESEVMDKNVDTPFTRESGVQGEGREGRKGKEGNTRQTRKTNLPENFSISDNVRRWAEDKKISNLDEHLESFKLKAQAKNYQYADWDAAFRNAIVDDWAGISKRGNQSNGRASNDAPRQRRLLTVADLGHPEDAA